MRTSISAATIAAALAATPTLAQDRGELSVTTGVDYSSGDYGTGVDTDILVVPFNLRYKTGDVRFTATIPWLRIDGSSAIVGDGRGGGVVIDPNAPRTRRSGFGDLTLGATYGIPEERLGVGLDLSARVKLPTASRSKGLGTGKVDVTVGAGVSKSFGPVAPFANVGYRIPGDPDGFDLRNSWTASGGASVVLGKAVVLASYDYRQSSSVLAEDSHEVFGALSAPVSKKLSLTTYGSAGLSDGAPDFGLGGMATLKF